MARDKVLGTLDSSNLDLSSKALIKACCHNILRTVLLSGLVVYIRQQTAYNVWNRLPESTSVALLHGNDGLNFIHLTSVGFVGVWIISANIKKKNFFFNFL